MHKRTQIQEYLEAIGQLLPTKNLAGSIQEELASHIDELAEEARGSGMSEDMAIDYALKHMGDPREVGLSFNSPTLYHAHRIKMRLFRWLGFFSAIIAGILFVIAGSYTEDLDMSFMIIIYLSLIGTLIQMRQYTVPSKYLDIDTTPLMIIWPSKQRISPSNLLIYGFISLIFGPIVAVFALTLIAPYFLMSPLGISLSLGVTFMMTMIFRWISEKHRIPKFILTTEGLILREQFIPWIALQQIRWHKDFLGASSDMLLELIGPEKLPLGKKIKVSMEQIPYVKHILGEYIS